MITFSQMHSNKTPMMSNVSRPYLGGSDPGTICTEKPTLTFSLMSEP